MCRSRNNMCMVIICRHSACRQWKGKRGFSKLGSNHSSNSCMEKSKVNTQHWHKSAVSLTACCCGCCWRGVCFTHRWLCHPSHRLVCGICSTYTKQYPLGQGLYWLSKLQGQMLDYSAAIWSLWKLWNLRGCKVKVLKLQFQASQKTGNSYGYKDVVFILWILKANFFQYLGNVAAPTAIINLR